MASGNHFLKMGLAVNVLKLGRNCYCKFLLQKCEDNSDHGEELNKNIQVILTKF